MAIGISSTGDNAEQAFRRITGATPSARAADGDAVLDGYNIEIKKVSANTLNQVRAVKFIPLVAFHSKSSKWYVVPAPDVVKLVAQKQRGQHTENPFESATLSLSKLGAFEVQDESQLATAVRLAIARGNAFPSLEAAMRRVLEQSKDLAVDSRKRVSSLLCSLGV